MDLQTLCIPRVNMIFKENNIRKIFEELNIGKIERIDIVQKNKEKFNSVFIHLKWNNLDNTQNARKLIESGKEIKVLYDDFWFWKIYAYKSPETRFNK